ncbi:MAG: hypothetical protein E6G08_03265 [Actinobacteria bacterium]|nr:MAG: hypothetical protein E6G08_03265 [Actinomycetota bacterium]
MLVRAGAWCGAGALVVLAARVLAYALAPAPSELTFELQRSVGGPRLVIVSLWSLGLAAAIAAAALGLAVLAVRERLALERAIVVAPPRLRPLRFCRRYAVLVVSTAAAFTLLESYVHWRAGLGWHGLSCLTGPVHRDAIPLLAALSLVAAACAEAVDHLLVWARRTLARRLPFLPAAATGSRSWTADRSSPARRYGVCPLPPRGPPSALESAIAAAI